MMMGAGLILMLVIGLILIGVPVLVVSIIAGGGLTTLFKQQNQQTETDHSSSLREPASERTCPSCGRTVRPEWNVCPSCGAALT